MNKLITVCSVMAMLVLIGPEQKTQAQNKPQVNCPYSQLEWHETKLFMGLSRSDGGAVSKHEWDKFVAENFVSRFPNGFTIVETTGYWRDDTTKATVYENGKQVVILHVATADIETTINEIAEKYRSQFEQQSVLISSSRAIVRFCAKP